MGSVSGQNCVISTQLQPPSQICEGDFREALTERVARSLSVGKSLIVVGESGSGKTFLAKAVAKQTEAIYCNYAGSVKATLISIAIAVDCPTTISTANSEKPMKIDQLKEELSQNLKYQTLIIDNVQRWPASLKYWLEEMAEAGVTMLLLGTKRDLEGLSFKIPKLVLPPLADSEVRSLVYQRAAEIGLALPSWQVSDVAGRAGGNPMLAYRFLDELITGATESLDASVYIDITPMIMSELMVISAVRFIGLATSDKSLYIIGGLGLTVFVMLKYILRMFPRGDRRR